MTLLITTQSDYYQIMHTITDAGQPKNLRVKIFVDFVDFSISTNILTSNFCPTLQIQYCTSHLCNPQILYLSTKL